jgi:hypothetical protein
MSETILQVGGGFQAFFGTIHGKTPEMGLSGGSFYNVMLALIPIHEKERERFQK